MTTTVWLSPSATAFSCLCEPCLEAARRSGALFSDALLAASVRGNVGMDTALGVVRCAAGHEIVLRRGERPPGARLARRRVVELQLHLATPARAFDRRRRRAVGRRGQGQDRRPARAGLGRRLPLPGRAERRAHDHRRRRDVQDPADAERRHLGQDVGDRRRLRRRPAGAARRARRARSARHRHVGRRRLRQRAPDHAVAHRDRPGVGAAARERCRSARRAAASAPPTPTRPRGSASASRTCSTRRSSARRSRSRSPRRTSGSKVYEVAPFDLEEVWEPYGGATPSGSRRTSATRRCSSTRRSATASTCSSRARRRRSSTSTTARIRS